MNLNIKGLTPDDTEEFLAIVKLVSGEEIITLLSPLEEDDDIKLMVFNHPLTMTAMRSSQKGSGIRFDHWMKFAEEYVFAVDFNKIITLTRVKNNQLKFLYKKFIQKYGDNEISHMSNERYKTPINKSLGLVGNVDEMRNSLEHLFSKSVSS